MRKYQVSLEFFEDVFIPHFFLPKPSVYDHKAKLWVWKYEGSEEGGIFSMHEQVRFRVESISYAHVEATTSGRRTAITEPSVTSAGAPGHEARSPTLPALARHRATSIDLTVESSAVDEPPCMQITASVNDHGLGLVCWNWE